MLDFTLKFNAWLKTMLLL